jgi:hypothetical protein
MTMPGENDAAAAAAAAVAAPGPAWFAGKVDKEITDSWTAKGYDINDPVKVATELTKAYKNAEGLLGRPKDQLIYVPTDFTKEPDAVKAAFQRLGAPVDAKDYDFPALKDKDGKVTNMALENALRAVSGEALLTKDAASKVAAAVVKTQADAATAQKAEEAAALTTERATLAKNWGVTPERLQEAPNMVVAKAAAAALKITPEILNALEKSAGYAKTMEMFREIGARMGEDKFIKTEVDGKTQIASKEAAQARLAELKRDTAWVARLNNGDTAANRELTDLNTIISA